jgi:hypothetical protein
VIEIIFVAEIELMTAMGHVGPSHPRQVSARTCRKVKGLRAFRAIGRAQMDPRKQESLSKYGKGEA